MTETVGKGAAPERAARRFRPTGSGAGQPGLDCSCRPSPGRGGLRHPRTRRKEGKCRVSGEGRAAPRGWCAPPGASHSTTWPPQAKRSDSRSRRPAPATHQSGGAGELGAGEHLTLFGAVRLDDVGDRRRGLVSRFLSEEAKGLKVRCPPGACPSRLRPAASEHAVSVGPSPNKTPTE